jgi:hypothetical protein
MLIHYVRLSDFFLRYLHFLVTRSIQRMIVTLMQIYGFI